MGGMYIGPSGPIGGRPESREIDTIVVEYPEGVRSIKTVNRNGVVDVLKGYVLASVCDCDGHFLRAGAVVVLAPMSLHPFAGEGRWVSPECGLVGVEWCSPDAVVEVALAVRLPDELRELRRS